MNWLRNITTTEQYPPNLRADHATGVRAVVTEALVQDILNGAGCTRNEIEQLCHAWLLATPQSSAPVVGDALRAAAQAVVTGKVNPHAGRTRLVMLKDVQALESALTGRGGNG